MALSIYPTSQQHFFIDKIDDVFDDIHAINEIEVGICDTSDSVSRRMCHCSKVFGRVRTTQANATRLFLLPLILWLAGWIINSLPSTPSQKLQPADPYLDLDTKS